MLKTFYLMTGLPRTGSSLLSALLNQHPSVYASPQSDLLQLMFVLDKEITNLECYRSGVLVEGSHNTVASLGSSYYSHINKPIVVDKHFNWLTPYNYNLVKILNPNFRAIVLVRPILEILASYIVLAKQNLNANFIDLEMNQKDFYNLNYKDIDDARCDYLMRPWGQIDTALLSLANAKHYPDNVQYVFYEDLINDKELTMYKISKFLSLSKFDYSFDKIKNADPQNDALVFGIPNLHTIRKKIKKESVNPKEVLSDYVINKYKDTLSGLLPTKLEERL